jgi:hypothetical protein
LRLATLKLKARRHGSDAVGISKALVGTVILDVAKGGNAMARKDLSNDAGLL